MPAPPAVPAPPKVRHITSWIRRRPGNLDTGEQLQLTGVLAVCPHLDALHHHVKAFAEMMTGRHGGRLDTWIAAVRADDLSHLHTFANGLERDHAAVLNGLTLPYNSGAVEGNVCRVKAIKRSRYGRAKLDLPLDRSGRGPGDDRAPIVEHHVVLAVSGDRSDRRDLLHPSAGDDEDAS